MKRFVLLISLIVAFGILEGYAQDSIVSIPDNYLLNALIKAGVDTSGDKQISYAEAQAVHKLDLKQKNITDLTGLEAFINLDSLDFSGNSISTIDLSHFPKLMAFLIADNQLQSLDVSGNPDLQLLFCQENEINALDVTKNPKLIYLSCWYNQLSELDVSQNPDMKYLWCGGNPVSTLDVSKNPMLNNLNCFDMDITEINVSNNPELLLLWAAYSPITAFDLTNNTKMQTIDFTECPIKELDVTNMPDLHELWCSGTLLCSLDISNNQEMGNGDDGWADLHIKDNPYLHRVCVWEGFPEGVDIKDDGSPNVYYTTECNDNLPPALDTTRYDKEKDIVYFLSNETGKAYLVPKDTDGNIYDIIDSKLHFRTIEADEESGFLLSSFDDGVTWIYAIDQSGNISKPIDSKTILVLNPNTLIIDSTGKASFTIESNTYWQISGFESWLSASDTSGTGDATITLTANTITYEATRTAILTVSGAGVSDQFIEVTQIVGISDHSYGAICIYPNPTNRLLTIESAHADRYSIEIISLSGQLIYAGEMDGSTRQIDMSQFTKGVYFVRVRSEQLVWTEKLIKL